MRMRNLVLVALAPLITTGVANAAMDEMKTPELRLWSTALGAPDAEGMGTTLEIVASQSTQGSNGMVIESVALMTTKTTDGEDGTSMTDVVDSDVCSGPFKVEGGAFTVEAAMMEEEAGAKEESEPACAFAVSGEVWHAYRPWHSWDLAGSVSMGDASAEFRIADMAPAMVLEPEPEEEKGSS